MLEVDGVSDKTKYLLVDASVLPEVFLLVVEAKQLLARGKAKSLSEAAELVGISRSTFYKYKDAVFTYDSELSRRVATIYAELEDRAGVLSSLLAALCECGANILTINQNIPVDGVAPVSISVRNEGPDDPEALRARLGSLDGVVTVRLLSN